MPRKTCPARVETFFRALAETGNRSIAAERARVSRDWVRVRGKADPAFAARVTATVAAAAGRLRAAGSIEPAATWRAQAGEELVVRGGNGRQVQIRRARLGEWTPRSEARFLAALASCCNVSAACRTVGLTTVAAYNHYRAWPDFAKRWDAALAEGYVRLELALFDTARRVFDAADYPPDVPIEPMSFDQAVTLLRQHQLRVHGSGKQHGGVRQWRPRSGDEAFASLAHKLDRMATVIERQATVDPDADRRAVERGKRIVARRD